MKLTKWTLVYIFLCIFLIFQTNIVLANNIVVPYEWYRYQGASDSDDKEHDCGPACVAMAIQFTKDTFVPIRDIRNYIGHTGATTSEELKDSLQHWGISYNHLSAGAQNVIDAVNDRNHIVICPVTMSCFSPGLDIDSKSDDPDLHYNRYSSFSGGHFIIVKGISDDGNWIIVYDPNVWGSYPYPKYWYSNGEPKGKERYYKLSEFYNAINSRGIEILPESSTIYVPDDYSTIQAAVDAASSGDTIIVRDGSYDESITFPSVKVIILQSENGASSTIIQGNDGSPTVTLINGPLEDSTLKGFTITHVNGLIGKGIWNYRSNLSINNCIISNNNFDYPNAATFGGGIGNEGSLTINGSTISGNYAPYGGGIENFGTLTITGSTISNNYSHYGGGIAIWNTLTTITGSTISNNYALYDGGGIYLPYLVGYITIGGSSTTDKSAICGNYISGYSPSLDQQIRDESGSLYETYKDTNYISAYCGALSGSVHNLTKDTYYNTIQAALDDADSGNTIEVDDGTYDESITFPSGKKLILQSLNGASSTTIRGNNGWRTVTSDGSLAGTTLEGFTITYASGNEGRGIVNSGNLNIKNCIISGNSIRDGYGGGIYNGGSMTISGSTISGNSSSPSGYGGWGGGGGIYNSGTLTITESTISDNYAFYESGGILNEGSMTISGSTISGNHGRGIYNKGVTIDAILTITESTISGNTTSFDGGGILNGGSMTISGSTISDNYATYNGGGIKDIGSSLTIIGSTISGNSAGYNNGGIYLIYQTSGTLTIGGSSDAEKNTICGNYRSGDSPSLDQQIRDDSGDLYETYKDTNYISAYCSIEDQPPTIEIISPSDGETVSGTVRFSTYATDDYGLDKVEFFIDDELKVTHGPFGLDTVASTCNWDCDTTTGSIDYIPNGNHTFKAKACDTGGQTCVDIISFVVDNVVENQPPSVQITSGPSGTIDYNDVTFTWSGNDPDGEVTGYYYELDDPTPENWTTETNHTFNSVSEGNHTFYVQAKDNMGATSSVISRSFTYTPPVSTSDISVEEVEICKMSSYNPNTNNVSVNVIFKNIGEVIIDSFQIELYINGKLKHVEKEDNKNLDPGDSGNSIFYWTLSEDVCGDNMKMEIKITDVNPVESNVNTENNSKTKNLSIYYVTFNIKEETYSFKNPGFNDWPKLKSTLDELKPLIKGVCFWALGKILSLKGVCYGMASTVIAYKEGSLAIPYGGTVNDLELTMTDVSNNILVYQTNLSALGLQIHRTVDQIRSNFPCVSDEYQKIIISLQEGKLKMLTLGESGTFKAHQLVAYQCIKDKDTNITYVYFYDPNESGYEWIGELYPETFFFYSFSGDNYDMLWAENLKPLPTELIEEYINDLVNLMYDGLKSARQELINVFSSINPFKNKNGVIEDTLITDEYGRKIGYLDGAQINEIPDGVIEIFGNFQTYQIPLSLNYDIQIKGKEQGVFELHLTKPNPDDTMLNLIYQDVPTENNSEASLTIGPSVTDFTMQLDQDGDGVVDEIKDPDFIEGVSTFILGDFGSADNGPPDCKVDFEDLMIFALAYGSTSSDPNWNPVCDIAGPDGSLTPDGVIDFEDLMIFAMHYGETCADQ